MSRQQFTGYEDLTVGSSAVGFTAATYSNANYASVLVENGPVRFTLDGTTPTASVGDVLEQGDRLILHSATEIAGAKFIRKDGVSATLRSHFAVSSGAEI